MNKTTKSILYGVGTFIISIVAIVGLRSLIKGTPIETQIKDWYNWAIAIVGGACTAWSYFKKSVEKEEQEKKAKKDNQ